MSTSSLARLLPWATREGKPCYLISDGSSYLSRLADNTETVQLDMGAELLEHAAKILGNPEIPPIDLRYLTARLSEALAEILCVAESRGARLAASE